MRVAVINEVSARSKNGDILLALEKPGLDVYNVGLTNGEVRTELTYIHTGFMAGVLLNLGLVDMVIGGCGTGQGFLNSAMQYPNVFCGLIEEPLDAFLFSRINAGNCISLALNKGYGWAGDMNLAYIFEKLFSDATGHGYPPERSASQRESRQILQSISGSTHRPFAEIMDMLDQKIVQTAFSHRPFYRLIAEQKPEEIRKLPAGIKNSLVRAGSVIPKQ